MNSHPENTGPFGRREFLAASAGIGTDAQPWFRIFNPVTQGLKFDPDGAYVRRWVPELEVLPTKFIHEPWKAPGNLRVRLDYPEPIVDHAFARARFLETARHHFGSKRAAG